MTSLERLTSAAAVEGKLGYPRGDGEAIQYGTAGFRTRNNLLDHVMYRMGLLAVIRSKYQKGQSIGVMVTASHNPDIDNGVKLVDPLGEMLEPIWEPLATKLANTKDEDLGSFLKTIIETNGIQIDTEAKVIIGRDTRSSSVRLSNCVKRGVAVFEGNCLDLGEVTTPQLHFAVLQCNTGGEPTEKVYYETLAKGFTTLLKQYQSPKGRYSPRLYFDGSNGVGAGKFAELLKKIEGDHLQATIFNDGTKPGDILNHQCGADFVKTKLQAPRGIPDVDGTRCCSVDGDADRLIYYLRTTDGIKLLDGDRIATLMAAFLVELIRESGLSLQVGLVQTAYANGASTHYIQDHLKMSVACVPTGVKHLHHKAKDLDIGVYFEANGHGTVLFSNQAMKRIQEKLNETDVSETEAKATRRLLAASQVINPAVGDALADLLLVEAILRVKGWDLADWHGCYTDLPNRLDKVIVKDRYAIVNIDARERSSQPEGLQNELDALMKRVKQGRTFVRPSGTENVVRVYAEAATEREATWLAASAAECVHRLAGGVGSPPTVASL